MRAKTPILIRPPLQITIDQYNMRKDSVSREVLRHEEFEGCVELKRIRDWFICTSVFPFNVSLLSLIARRQCLRTLTTDSQRRVRRPLRPRTHAT